MTGGDALLIARRAVVLVLAQRRLDEIKAALAVAQNDDDRALLRAHHKSAALSVAGYRRGLDSAVASVVGAAIGLPALALLPWQIQNSQTGAE